MNSYIKHKREKCKNKSYRVSRASEIQSVNCSSSNYICEIYCSRLSQAINLAFQSGLYDKSTTRSTKIALIEKTK